jgi:hypothetical protein
MTELDLAEVSKLWKRMQDSDKEHDLFNAYVEARRAYLDEIKAHVKAQVNSAKIPDLYRAERDAFTSYLAHRTQTKPEA